MIMKPYQLESLVYRMCGRSNASGDEAHDLLRRFNLDPVKHKGVFDCDARAEIAIRLAKNNGYSSRTAVQAGKVPHRYVILKHMKTGVESPILKRK